MSEMTSENDKERCLWFHNVIEDHVMAAVSLTFPTKELQEEVSRIFHDDRKARRMLSNPWYLAIGGLIWMYTRNIPASPLPQEPIDFIFDETTEKTGLLRAWDSFSANFKNSNPETAKLIGATPVFRNDREFLPLQAADFFAWWVRHWQVGGIKTGKELLQCQFPWPRKKNMQWTCIDTTRPQLVSQLERLRTGRLTSFPFS
jgi:hypothetical protein